MAMPETIKVELVYIKPGDQCILHLNLPAETTIESAIYHSGLLKICPEIDLSVNRTGVFGKLKPLTHELEDGDRLEIYRPLQVDPKEARRRRAARKK